MYLTSIKGLVVCASRLYVSRQF